MCAQGTYQQVLIALASSLAPLSRMALKEFSAPSRKISYQELTWNMGTLISFQVAQQVELPPVGAVQLLVEVFVE